MGADILEALQLGSEPLDEDRARRQRRAEPVAVLREIRGEAEECPGIGKAALLVSECQRIGQGSRPVGGKDGITAKGHFCDLIGVIERAGFAGCHLPGGPSIRR